MLLQTFNYFIKLAKKAMNKTVDAGELDPNLAYLNGLSTGEWKRTKSVCNSPECFLNLDTLFECLQVTLLWQMNTIMERRKEFKASKKDLVNSIFAVDIVTASTNHIRFLTF